MAKETQYDVFLSHNSQDKPAVEILARRLTDEASLRPFLDKWHLVPGEPWQEALEEALDQSRTCAVFVGPRGISPWEHEEMRAGIEQRVADRTFRVIPVLLPGAERGKRGRLPAFLKRATWVEFRETLDDPDAFHRLVAGIKGLPPGRGPGEVVYEGVCPYRGLQAFEEEHAPFFFGREAATEWLVNDLRGSRFLAVVGPSGSGKSSLVRAGLVPALRRGDLPGSETWPLCVFRPGHRPLESLAVALIQLVGSSDDPTALSRLMDALGADQRQLHLTIRLALTDAPADRTIALVVDQFEEIFTLCRYEDQRGPFIDNLLYASAIEGGRTVVVLTLRADFYGKCAAYPDLAARFTDHQMLVSPMVEEELRQAIERPARLVGLEFESGLVEALLRDVQAEPGALPLLQHTLLELWERREGHRLTSAAYREIGNIQGAIAHRAESIYAGFDAAQRAITRRVLLRLTQPGEGTEDTRRRATLAELLPAEGEPADVETAVRELADARLLTTGKDERGDEIVDVSHEALIRGWPRLREWIEEDREGLRTHRRLTEATNEWEENNRDESYLHRGTRLAEAEEWAEAHVNDMNPLEREFLEASVEAREARRIATRRRVQRVIAGLVTGLVTISALAIFAWGRSQLAEQRRVDADNAKATAQAESTRAINAESTAVAEATRALNAEATADARRLEAEEAQADAEAQRDEAKRQRQIALSRQLAAQALTHLDDQLDLALLLSLEANRITDTVEVRDSLLAGLESSPHLTTFLHGHTDWVRSVAFSSDGQTLASGSRDGTILLWDVAAGQPLGQPLTGHSDGVFSVAFSPDGQTLASGSADGAVILWDIATGQPIGQPLTGHDFDVFSVAFSPDGQTLASASRDLTIRLWDVATGQPIGQPLTGHSDSVFSVAFSPDGQMLASGSRDLTIRLWNVTAHQPIGQPLTGHSNWVNSVAFSPDGQVLASGSRDGTIILWDVAARQPIGQPLTGHSALVHSVAFSPDGQMLASGSHDGTIILWDVAARQPLGQPLTGHSNWVNSVAFSPNGQTLASGSHDGTIILWDVTAHQPIGQPLTGHSDSVLSVAFSPNGQTLASGSKDDTIILWDVATGQPISQPLAGHSDSVFSVAFSPGGQTLASGSKDDTIMLWDAATGQPISQPLTGHAFDVFSVAFSPDGQMLASGSQDGTIILWDVATGQPIGQPLTGHSDSVFSVAFNPDGQTLASSSYDSTIILWDVAARQPLGQPLAGHPSSVNSVAFSPDGQMLASGSQDGTIILWDASFESWQARACRIANRGLTQTEWRQFIGPDVPYERTCPDLASGEGAPLVPSTELPATASPTSTPVLVIPAPSPRRATPVLPTATPTSLMATKTPTQAPVLPTATATDTPTTVLAAVPQPVGPIVLTIYLRDTLTETGFATLSGDWPNGGIIYKEGKFVYGEAAVQIGETTYHFDKPEVEPGEPEQLPDPWRVEFEFAEGLVAHTGNQAGFNPKKAQFWVGTLDGGSAVDENNPYNLTMKLYEGNELRKSIQVFFIVGEAPESLGGGEEGGGGGKPEPD
jgi:WD40 repeat protein